MKLKLHLFSIVMILFIILNLYIPFFTYVDFNPLNQQRVILEIPRIKQSNQGYINTSDEEIFWFIHMSDVHYTGLNDSTSAIYLNNFFNTTCQEINPLFVINTGNLVYGNDFTTGFSPNLGQWLGYWNVLETNNLNSSRYIDLIGNHDVSMLAPDYDYFLNYSMIGSEFGVTQYSFNKSFSFGKYAFITLDTTRDIAYSSSIFDTYNFDYIGYLYTENLDWYEAELEKNKDYDKIFTFGHNVYGRGTFNIISEYTSISALNFDQLNAKYNVSSYICGHSQINNVQKINDLFQIETTTFPLDMGTYRIIAIDHNQLSTSVENSNIWPQGVITFPPSTSLYSGGLNLSNSDAKIRALAWDPLGVNYVEWCAYDESHTQVTNWVNLSIVDSDEPLWQGDWNNSLNDGDSYYINIKINGESGETTKEIICNFGERPDDPSDDTPDDSPGNFFDDLLGLLNMLYGFKYLPAILITSGIFVIVISITGTILHRRRTR